jgi:universal stress protein A
MVVERRHQERGNTMIQLKKILVPIDFSESTEKAIRYGLEIAKDRKAHLFLLHVIDQRLIDNLEKMSAWGYKGDFAETIEGLVRDREQDLLRVVPEEWAVGLEPEYLIRRGKPAEEVINTAKEYLIDLIVIGTQGHTAFASTILGGVCQKVVNHGPCPVLVVRPIEHDFIGENAQ